VWVGESSFWYRPTRVVPDQRPLNGRCWHLVLCCYFSIRFALFHNDIRASCNICNHICQVVPLCTLVWYMVTWVSRVYTQWRLHDFLMVQLFYNSFAQIHPSYSPGVTTVHRHVMHFLAQACILAPPGEYDWMCWMYLQLKVNTQVTAQH